MEVGTSRRGKRRSGRTAQHLACVSGGFLLCLFFCGSASKSYSRAKAKPREKQKTTWGRVRAGEGSEKNRLQFFSLPSLLASSPIVFFFVLGSGFARLNLLLYARPKKKHTKKPANCADYAPR